MNTEKFIECERKRLNKLVNFRLPYRYKVVGLVIAALSIITMFVRAFGLEGEQEVLKEIAKKGLLVGMLLMSLSRDKEEDEMTVALRVQSYTMAFVAGTVYALVMPYVEYGVSNVVNDGGEAFKDLPGFQILIFMLLIQLMFYHTLKRYR
jgi:hypothetical protein